MANKLGVYDIIGILIPGAIFLWGIQLPLRLQNVTELIPTSGGLTEGSIFLLLSYGCGLLIQGLSFVTVEPIYKKMNGGLPSVLVLLKNDQTFTDEMKHNIIESAKQVLGIDAAKFLNDDVPLKEQKKLSNDIFRAFNDLLEGEKLSERPLRFNAQYGLFRAFVLMFFVFFVQTLLWSLGMFGDIVNPQIQLLSHYLFWLWLSLVLISITRMHKRANDFARSVYQTALLLRKEQ